MAISGIGATPQPEQNNYDPVKEEEEQYAASIFQSLNKNGDNQIDEKDGLDNSMLKALKNFVGSTLTLENLKKVAGKLPEFTYTKTAQYLRLAQWRQIPLNQKVLARGLHVFQCHDLIEIII